MPDHSEIDVLKAHRAAVADRIATLTAQRRRLTDAERAESVARAALDDLGRQEMAAARQWAADGAEGSMPAVDAAERGRLTAELVVAEAASAAARGAGAGVDAELGEAQHDVARLAVEIEHAAVDHLAEAFLAEIETLRDRAVALQGDIARSYAVVAVLRDVADEHQLRGRDGEARRVLQLLERLGGRATFDVVPTNDQVAGYKPALVGKLAELTR